MTLKITLAILYVNSNPKRLIKKNEHQAIFDIILYGQMSVRPVAQRLAQINVYNKGKMGHRYTELS